MSILEAVVLGAVQGITEFVPISSSGHLVLVPATLGWGHPSLTFDVMLHAASLIALLVFFSGELLDLWHGLVAGDHDARRLLWLLVLGTIPAVIAAVLLGDYFKGSFTDARASAVQLVINALILVAGEQLRRYHERRAANEDIHLRVMLQMRPTDAGVIGFAQAVAILPGISRSGTTIATGLGLAITRDDAARFAFLLAIPALLGAAIVEAPKLAGGSLGVGAGIAGFFASLVTSYIAISALIRYLRTNTLYPFAVYCVVAGTAFYLFV